MTLSDPERVAGSGSLPLRLLGLALILSGVAVIFAGELEVLLPRTVITSAVGGALMGLGIWVSLRGRSSKA